MRRPPPAPRALASRGGARRTFAWSCALSLGLGACVDDPVPSADPPHAEAGGAGGGGPERDPTACEPGTWRVDPTQPDSACVPAGRLADAPCAAGSFASNPGDASSCVPAGATACADRSSPEAGVCAVAAVATECAAGRVGTFGGGADPNVCVPLGPCVEPGDLPDGTVFVDASAELPGDGSAAAPYATLAEALAVAAPGATIWLRPGSYAAAHLDAPVVLRGTCAEEVELVASEATSGTVLEVDATASGTIVEGVTLRGLPAPDAASRAALVVQDVSAFVLRATRIHAAAAGGAALEGGEGIRFETVLVDDVSGFGVRFSGARASVTELTVRDIADGPTGDGTGVVAGPTAPDAREPRPTVLEASGLVVARYAGTGVLVDGATVEGTRWLVRDPIADAASPASFAIRVEARPESGLDDGAPPALTLDLASVEGAGLVVGAPVVLRRATVRAVNGQGFAFGVAVEAGASLQASSVAVAEGEFGVHLGPATALVGRGLLVTRASRGGLAASEASIWLGGSAFVDNRGPGLFTSRGTGTVEDSVWSDNQSGGIVALGGALTIRGSSIIGPAKSAAGTAARGLEVGPAPSIDESTGDDAARTQLTITASEIRSATEVALLVHAADVVARGLRIVDTRPRDGFSRALAVQATGEDDPATAQLDGVSIEGGSDVGLATLRAHVEADGLVVEGTKSRADGSFGDGILVASSAVGDPSSLALRHSSIRGSARYGVANIASAVTLVDTTLECNGAALGVEASEAWIAAATFDDGGGNLCGCAEVVEACVVTPDRLGPP